MVPRCKKGTRKCSTGKCVKISNKKTKNRCKKGSRKCANKRCYNTITKRLELTETPRTKYDNKYHSSSIYLKENTFLFQVNFKSQKQFTEYTNLYKTPRIDCVYQSLFSLGLRPCELSKKDSKLCNLYGKSGVTHKNIQYYLCDIFGLENNDIMYKFVNIHSDESYDDDLYDDSYIYYDPDDDATLKHVQNELQNNFATIIILNFSNNKGVILITHAIIMYKYKNKIYFFDPQRHGINNSHVNNLKDFKYKYHIEYFGYFKVEKKLSTPILMKDECPPLQFEMK